MSSSGSAHPDDLTRGQHEVTSINSDYARSGRVDAYFSTRAMLRTRECRTPQQGPRNHRMRLEVETKNKHVQCSMPVHSANTNALLSPHTFLHLQRAVGNRAVRRLMARPVSTAITSG